MANAVIGALRVSLGADSAQFHKAMSRAQTEMQGLGATFARVGKAMTLATAGIAAAMTTAMRSTAKDFDGLAKASQALGVPVDELSRLRHAADLSGVGFEEFSTGMRRVAESIADAAANATGPAARAFSQLGIAVRDAGGKLKPSSMILDEVADRFAGMEDGARKTALAIDIFGRNGAAMIPLLNSASTGIAAMKAEADRLGIVIDTKTAKAAEAFNDNLTRLGTVFDAIRIQMTAGALPALQDMSARLAEAAGKTTIFRDIGAALGKVMEGVARGISFAADNLGTFARVAGVMIAMKISSTVVGMGLAFVKLASAIRLAGIASAAASTLLRLKSKIVLTLAAAAALAAGKLDSMRAAFAEVAAAVEGMIPEGVGNAVVETFRAIGLETDALTKEFEGLKTAGTSVADVGARLEDAFANAGKGARKLKTESDTVGDGIKDIATAAEKMRTDMASAFETVGSGLAGVIKGTSTWRDVLGDVFRSMTQILAQRFSEAMPGSGSGSGGLFGSLISGFAKSLFRFREGGSFTVGGSGGADSQLVAFRATPGEMVDVRTPGQAAGGMMVVNIHNHSGEQVQTREARTAQGGRSLEVMIGKVVAGQIATPGSPVARSLQTVHGLSPNVTRRS